MLTLLRSYTLTRSIKSYVFKLGPSLRQRYGSADQYTVHQILKTIEYLNLNSKHFPYAVALYCHEPSEELLQLTRIDQGAFESLRQELANAAFDGKVTYRATDVLALTAPASWKGGSAPNWWMNRTGRTSV